MVLQRGSRVEASKQDFIGFERSFSKLISFSVDFVHVFSILFFSSLFCIILGCCAPAKPERIREFYFLGKVMKKQEI